MSPLNLLFLKILAFGLLAVRWYCMPSYCTVCGVKLTAKNRISYRPSSCRDCELERKRLYSLKRKLQKEQEKEQQEGKSKGKNCY